MKRHLIVGGLVAVGFDQTGSYLLTVSHSGRGVFSTTTWERVARDYALAYPEAGTAVGIGPIAGKTIPVATLDSEDGITITSPDHGYILRCESDGIEITKSGA
jgi:hypothetical protein